MSALLTSADECRLRISLDSGSKSEQRQSSCLHSRFQSCASCLSAMMFSEFPAWLFGGFGHQLTQQLQTLRPSSEVYCLRP